ncbi:deoxyribonuclease-2-alpha-like [Rhinatrema bivittatum]|uniref:deoxyribonuclease-2-alpha-like n=1 Tax=Rhinatrema bivittatum TaxID=194408 RepID=UPI0011277548|nr:deoxyribonuclease-2-alpha-like [Rhinatrema bivittatum]
MRPQRSPASPLAALRLLALACLACRAGAGISCYGDSGRPVDWFIVYKLPKLEKTSLEGGLRYMYQDARSAGWQAGKALINSTEGAVGRTLQQLYGSRGTRKEDVAHVLYNDQPPAAFDPSNGGHTKGVVLLDKAQGFWLVHSAPHFPPPAKEGFSWPGSGRHNGQSFLCVTYAYRQFKDIGKRDRRERTVHERQGALRGGCVHQTFSVAIAKGKKKEKLASAGGTIQIHYKQGERLRGAAAGEEKAEDLRSGVHPLLLLDCWLAWSM